MKKIFLFLLVTIFSATVSAQSGRKIQAPPPPTPEPTIVEPQRAQPSYRPALPEEFDALPQNLLNHPIQSLDSGSLRLADYEDKVIVINLWATWCGPCRQEIPEYEKVRKEYANRSVEFIALTPENPNSSSDRVKKFVRNYNFGFRQGWADRDTAMTLMNGRNVLPQTYVIAPGGRIVANWRGYAGGKSGDRLRSVIEHALSESSASGQQFR